MHSNNVVRKLDTGQNRFMLCHQAFAVIRKQLNVYTSAREASRDRKAIRDREAGSIREASSALQRLSGAERYDASGDLADANNAAAEPAEQTAVNDHPDGALTAQRASALVSDELPTTDAQFRVLSV